MLHSLHTDLIRPLALIMAQPSDTFGPVGAPSSTEQTPSTLSNARIMGVCTVAVLVVAFFILYMVVATRKEKQKEIDLSKPLILTEEVGKKKKKKSKKNKKKDDKTKSIDEEELMPVGASEVSSKVEELPPRIAPATGPSLSTEPKSSSDDIPNIPTDSSEEATEDISDSQRYRSAN